MVKALNPGARIALIVLAVGFVVAGVLLAGAIPAVEGLGEKVRLPMFHGGSTWVNLVTFSIMGLLALAYLVFKREDLYRWAAGFRWVSAPLWLLNTVLGVIAAINTWDFSGSSTPPLTVIRDDPRLMAQFTLLIVLLALIVVQTLFDSRAMKAFADVTFAAVLWFVMGRLFLDPQARALHPDNPVLNSASDIQIPFFAIVGCIFVACVLVAWLVRDALVRAE